MVFLPPESVVRTTGGYVFTGVCVCSTFGGGTPSQVWTGGGTPFEVWTGRGYPIPGPGGEGGTPSQVQLGGVPYLRFGQGVPHLRSGQGVPHPRSRQGVPHPRSGRGGTLGTSPPVGRMGYNPRTPGAPPPVGRTGRTFLCSTMFLYNKGHWLTGLPYLVIIANVKVPVIFLCLALLLDCNFYNHKC